MTRPAGLLPVLAVPDPVDAGLVRDALLAAYSREPDAERRLRLATLITAAGRDAQRNTR